MSLKLHLFGQPNIYLDGRDITPQIGHKSLAVIAYLVLESPPLARERLASTFWSEKPDPVARYRLRHTLWELRRLLGSQYIGSDDTRCWINPDADLQVDVLEFERGCAALGGGTTRYVPENGHVPVLSALVGLYRGDLLDNVTVQDAPLFDEWLLFERERLQLLYQEVLWCLALAQQAAQDMAGAAQTLTRLIQVDPLRERSYRALMELYARQGDRAGALRVYLQCAQTLAAELGSAPASETQRLRERIMRGTPDPAGIELERALAQVETALTEGRPDEAKTLLCSARQALRDFFNR